MKKTAFSLLELAVVLVVIASITFGIIKGSALINDSRLSSARSLTSGSGISEIDGIVAWYETTLKESLEGDEEIDNAQMSTWNDISSQYNISEGENILTRTADANVVYRKEGINGLPSLQFAASGRFSLTSLAQGNFKNYTVFAVLSPTLSLSGVKMVFLDSYLTSNDNALSISAAQFEIDSGSSATISETFEQSQEYVIAAYLNASNSNVHVNDVDASSGTPSALTVNGFEGLTVGADRNGANNFTGLISEIIIFNRILSRKERMAIMSYLGKKYGIRVEGVA